MRRTRVQGRRAMDRIGEGGREAKKRNKLQESCRRGVENGRDLGGRRKECRQENIGPVDVNPEDQDNRKKEAQGAKGLSKNSRESVFPLSRLIRGFCNKYHV